MPQDHSFDVVSKVNLQEFRNAIQQAQKEIATRFDFRNSSASVEFDEPAALTMITLGGGLRCLKTFSNSTPLMPGMSRSSSTTSGANASTSANASSPPATIRTSKPLAVK